MLERLRQFTRTRRQRLFRQFIGAPERRLRIVDLGGTVHFWEQWGLKASDSLEITLVNNHVRDKTHADDEIRLPNIQRRWADVTTLHADELAEFDIIFSNSLIEHLPGRAAQRHVAQAVMRSGARYFIQTPNKHAPIDPHFPRPYVPFFAAYPRPLQARLLTWSALGSGSAAPSYEAALDRLNGYFPLSTRDVSELFPGAEIIVERPLGVPMSVIALYPGINQQRASVARNRLAA